MPQRTYSKKPKVPQPSMRRARQILKDLTASGISVQKEDDLTRYVAKHLKLGSLLAAICVKVRQEFGSTAELSLQLYRDPENRDRYLTLYVRQPKYETGILDRIEAVANQFMTQLEATTGHLLVTTDFRRARYCP